MNLLHDSQRQRTDFVLHPTDLSQASERAFHHALAFAIRSGAQFTLLHAVGRRATDNWVDFPSVRSKLAEWRAAGSVDGLDQQVRQASVSKIEVEMRDPVAACMHYIGRHAVDMIVLATEGRSGISRLLRASRAERLARESGLPTLFVPEGGRYFVDAGTGEVSLRRILIPIDRVTDARPAMLRAVQAAVLVEKPSMEITLLHMSEDEETSLSDVPDLPYCTWNILRRKGDVVKGILDKAEELRVDAIYMSTAWSRSSFGSVEGAVTEAVLASAPCPVAAIPAGRVLDSPPSTS